MGEGRAPWLGDRGRGTGAPEITCFPVSLHRAALKHREATYTFLMQAWELFSWEEALMATHTAGFSSHSN